MNDEDREHERRLREAFKGRPNMLRRFGPILDDRNRIKGYSGAVNEEQTSPAVGVAAETVSLAGSVRKLCYVCMARTWFSPRAQLLQRERDALGRGSILICDQCALDRQPEVMANVRRLDEAREQGGSAGK